MSDKFEEAHRPTVWEQHLLEENEKLITENADIRKDNSNLKDQVGHLQDQIADLRRKTEESMYRDGTEVIYRIRKKDIEEGVDDIKKALDGATEQMTKELLEDKKTGEKTLGILAPVFLLEKQVMLHSVYELLFTATNDPYWFLRCLMNDAEYGGANLEIIDDDEEDEDDDDEE